MQQQQLLNAPPTNDATFATQSPIAGRLRSNLPEAVKRKRLAVNAIPHPKRLRTMKRLLQLQKQVQKDLQRVQQLDTTYATQSPIGGRLKTNQPEPVKRKRVTVTNDPHPKKLRVGRSRSDKLLAIQKELLSTISTINQQPQLPISDTTFATRSPVAGRLKTNLPEPLKRKRLVANKIPQAKRLRNMKVLLDFVKSIQKT